VLAIVASPLLANVPSYSVPQPITDYGPYVVFFDTDSTKIAPPASPILHDFAEAWREFGSGARVKVNAHTDRVGSSESNRRLSCRRASRVRAYLVADGIPSSQIELFGWGEERSLVETPDEVAEAQNRRVELEFGSTENPQPTDAGGHIRGPHDVGRCTNLRAEIEREAGRR
jgi:outer membrane protein OmpA-like peptidoglycan-associated protein